MKPISLLTAVLLLVIGSGAHAGPVRFQDDFSQPGNWAGQSTATHTVSVADGKLRVANTAMGDFSSFRQKVSVGPAATWKASVDYRFEKFSPTDKNPRATLALLSPTGAQSIYVDVAPTGWVYVSLWAGKWVTLMNWAPASAARAGDSNTLTVERVSGYLTLSVNNVYVGRTAIVDFSPRALGVTTQSNEPAIVEFDNLRLEETGIDSRYARLLGLQAVPGARVFLQEDFTRKPGQTETWWIGADEHKSARIENGRYVVTGLKDTTDERVSTLIDTGLPGVFGGNPGYFLSARITPLAGDMAYSRGIVLIGEAGRNGEAPPSLSLEATQNQYRIVERRRDGSLVTLLDWSVSDSLVRDKENTLSLVLMVDDRVLAFINGEYQNTVLQEGFYPAAMGVRVTGPQTFAVDDFFATEF